MTVKQLKVVNAMNQKAIENIDLIWIKGKEIQAVFEVESTTTMTSALMRGSNVNEEVDKFMVLPEEREGQFKNKLTSPLFREHFENENWKLIYFDTLRIEYTRQKAKLNIYSLLSKKSGSSKQKNFSGIQGFLF
jgi:hypothetical protein